MESLVSLNAALAPVETSIISQFEKPNRRTLFVVGAPRSGHTLFSQLLAMSGAVAYISNFTARFWLAPVLATRIQKETMLNDKISLTSNYGRVDGLTSPHEGGYFLRRFINFSETHVSSSSPSEPVSVWQQEVAALEAETELPVMLRNIVYGLNLPIVLDAFPNAVIAVCRREARSHEQSILKARRVHGSEGDWWSARPDDFDQLRHLDPISQVRGQIASCYRMIEAGADRANTQPAFINVDYQDVCRSPRTVIGHVLRYLDVDPNLSLLPPRLEQSVYMANA